MKRYSLYNLAHLETPATIHVHSTEGDIYTAVCVLHEGEHAIICHDDGKILTAHSLDEMHTMLEHTPMKESFLVTRTPYDEMIGTDTLNEPVKTRLNWA